MTDEESIYTKDKMKQKTVYPTEQTPSYADWALFDMGKDLEDKVEGTEAIPDHTSEDAGKVLKVTAQNGLAWATDEQGHAQVQSNWNETDNTQPSYIQNKPTIPEGVPAYTTSDDGKVLGVTVDSSGDTPVAEVEWVEPEGGLPAIVSGDVGKVVAVNSSENGYELINKLDGFAIERYGGSNVNNANGNGNFCNLSFGGGLNCDTKDYIIFIMQEKDSENNSGAWIIEGKIFTNLTGTVSTFSLKVTGYDNGNGIVYYKYLVLSRNKKESKSSVYIIGTTSTGILGKFAWGSKGKVLMRKSSSAFSFEFSDIVEIKSENPTNTTEGYVGQIIKSNVDNNFYMCKEITGSGSSTRYNWGIIYFIPDFTSLDAGKVLSVNSNGELEWITPSS